MSTSALKMRIAIAWAAFRVRELSAILLLGLALASFTYALAAVEGASNNAADESAAASLGNRRYSIQSDDPGVRAILERSNDYVGVGEATAAITTSESLELLVPVRITDRADAQLGTLVAGRHPADGEMALTRTAQQTLGIPLGGTVLASIEGEPAEMRVVGMLVNRLDAREISGVMVSETFRPDQLSLWLSDRDPFLDRNLRPFMDSRDLSVQSLDATLGPHRALQSPLVSRIRPALWLLAAAASMLGILLIAAFAPSVRQDVRSLADAGLEPRSAWRVATAVALLTLALGEALGLCIARVVLEARRDEVATFLNEEWARLPFPASVTIALLIGSLGLGLVAHRAIPLGTSVGRMLIPPSTATDKITRASWILLLGGLVWLGICGLARFSYVPGGMTTWSWLGVAACAFAAPWTIRHYSLKRLAPALRATAMELTRTTVGIAALAAVVASLTTLGALRGQYDATAFDKVTRPRQPAGSLVAVDIPGAVADTIVERFRNLGGTDVAEYAVASERTSQLRSTSTALVDCMISERTTDRMAVPNGCRPTNTYSPVNIVALALDGIETARADVSLVSQGRVGLLQYQRGSAAATHIDSTVAKPDPRLGGVLPGLVVHPDSAMAKEYGLRPNGNVILALLEVQRLSLNKQMELRAFIGRVAPTGQVFDASAPNDYDQTRATATATAQYGALIALLLLGIGGGGALQATRRARCALRELGGHNSIRRRLLTMPPLLMATAMLCGMALAWVGFLISRVTLPGGEVGLYWPLATVLGLSLSLAFGFMIQRAPTRDA